MRSFLPLHATLLLLATAASLPAQQRGAEMDDRRWLENCRDGWSGDDRNRACEVRNVPVKLTGRAIEIDGQQNGGIRVLAWDGDSVRVTARIQSSAETQKSAEALLAGVRVMADGRRVSADGPRRLDDHERWSVSYLVMVPRHFDLTLDANNGSLGVTGVDGKLELRTTNGSVALNDVGGDVHAHTQNGSLNVQLVGKRWDGRGLDAETQNGSVRLSLPEGYAALLETGTVNGRINTDFPITVQGRIGRELSVPLNGGGPTIRARTTNGSVSLLRR